MAVIEADSSYEFAQTSRAQNSIREQFSQPVNIKISQYGLDFIDNFHENTQVGGESPVLAYRGTGYLFLAEDDAHLDRLEAQLHIQHEQGAATRMLTTAQVADEFPYMDVSSIAGARVGSMREGSFDAGRSFRGFASERSTMERPTSRIGSSTSMSSMAGLWEFDSSRAGPSTASTS